VSGWGLESSITLSDTLYQNRLLIQAKVKGGQGLIRYDWGSGFGTVSKQAFVPQKDTIIRVLTGTYKYSPYEEPDPNGIFDTAYFKIQVKGDIYSGPPELKNDKLVKHYLDNKGFRYSIGVGTATVVFEEIHSKGTADRYLSGYEITVKDWEQLETLESAIRKELRFYSMENENPIDILSIQDVYPDIFVWLDFLDINFSIIVVLMIAISIITMGASLLVLILEKTSTIGLLKALGASDWSIRKVFLYQSAYLIFRGMIWGNLTGIAISLLQMQFNIFPLDPEVYYLNAVPIELNLWHLLLLNLFTVLVCLLALVLPSYFITRVRPTEAIKFS
jgi:lipoprotein-releasing system permease protein